MSTKENFAPHVLLIDADYLDRVATDLRIHFSSIIGRELPAADISILLECLSLDAGITASNSRVQVVFLYEETHQALNSCKPSLLPTELNEMAFKGKFSEFTLSSFATNELVSKEKLFREMFQVIANDAGVKQMLIVPDEQKYLTNLLSEIEQIAVEKSIVLFGMNPSEEVSKTRFELLGFSILQALGIQPSEL